MLIEVTTEKFGDLIRVIFPEEFVKEQNIKENQKFLIDIVNNTSLSNSYL